MARLVSWIKQNWLALSSIIIAMSAFVLAYMKYKHDTRPALVLRRSKGGFEIENLGQGIAVGVSLSLIERASRPSARLHVEDVLKPGAKSSVAGFDYPEDLLSEMETNHVYSSFDDCVRRSAGERIKPSGGTVGSYVLTRKGKQILILRFRVVDGSKTFVRLFIPATTERGFVEVKPSSRVFRNRLTALLLQALYARNSQFAPPF